MLMSIQTPWRRQIPISAGAVLRMLRINNPTSCFLPSIRYMNKRRTKNSTMSTVGRFGIGREQTKLAVGLCYIGGDNSAKEFLRWTKQSQSAYCLQTTQARVSRSGIRLYCQGCQCWSSGTPVDINQFSRGCPF